MIEGASHGRGRGSRVQGLGFRLPMKPMLLQLWGGTCISGFGKAMSYAAQQAGCLPR